MIILTYNILNPCHAIKHQAVQGIHKDATGKMVSNWDLRKNKLVKNISASNCDVACLQEVSPTTLKPFQEQFKLSSYFEHSNNNASSAYGNCILTCSNLKILESGTFKTSETQFRTAAYTKIKEISSGLVYMIISVHLRGYDRHETDPEIKLRIKEDGYKELKNYLSQIETKQADVYVIAGDFNEHTSEFDLPKSRHQLLLDAGYFFDKDISPTEHGTNRVIDWIFVKTKETVKIKRIKCTYPHIEASDHFPYVIEIKAP